MPGHQGAQFPKSSLRVEPGLGEMESNPRRAGDICGKCEYALERPKGVSRREGNAIPCIKKAFGMPRGRGHTKGCENNQVIGGVNSRGAGDVRHYHV